MTSLRIFFFVFSSSLAALACSESARQDAGGAGASGTGGGAPSSSATGSCPDGGVPPDCAPKCTTTDTLVVDSTTLYSADAGPLELTTPPIGVDATRLYYVVIITIASQTTATLMSVRFSGGASTKLAALDPSVGVYFKVTSKNVLFLHGAEVQAVPIEGGSPSVFASGTGTITAWANDADTLYFSDSAGTHGMPLAGGSAHSITSQTGTWLAVGSGNLVLYDPSGTLSSVPIGGGAVTTIATQQTKATLLTTCGDSFCWINFNGITSPGDLVRLTPGSAPNTLLTSDVLREALGLVFDGTDYYTTAGGGSGPVTKIPGDGGMPAIIGTGGGGLAVDESCVYWSDFLGIHSLSKTAK